MSRDMEKIISTECGLEFAYDPDSNKSYFLAMVVPMRHGKSASLKFPFGISDQDLMAKVSQAIASGGAEHNPLTAELALRHIDLYERNIYYFLTLQHDPELRSFLSWLCEWYTRNFFASLAVLALESPDFESGLMQKQLAEGSGSGVSATLGSLLSKISSVANHSLQGRRR